MTWITGRLPTVADADIDGDVIIAIGDCEETHANWQTVTTGDLWRSSDFYEKININTTDDRWITGRQPLALDGNKDGAVHVRKYPDKNWGVNIHWSYVGPGVPWEHTKDYTGLVEPIPLENSELTQPEEVPWRGFTYITRNYLGSSFVLDAVATDGTAWYRVQNPGETATWKRIPNLPQD